MAPVRRTVAPVNPWVTESVWRSPFAFMNLAGLSPAQQRVYKKGIVISKRRLSRSCIVSNGGTNVVLPDVRLD